jgi:UDP-N-acetylglucosamine 4-epimerase
MSTYEKLLERIANERRTWLVTGVAGFIGSNLLESLLMLDQAVVGLDNFSTGSRENFDQVRSRVGETRWRNFSFIEGDIRSLDACRSACEHVDVILHQAALGSIPRSLDDPVETNGCNLSGFLNMLLAARDCGVARFVYASSSSVYGDNPRQPKVESQIGRLLSPYALTKYADELYAEVFSRCYESKTIGLRYFNIFGPRQTAENAYAAVIPAWLSAMLRNEIVYINGDGKTARDFCYVDNAVQANLRAAMVDDPAALNQVYNVAVDAQTSLDELFLMIRSVLAQHYPRFQNIQPVYRDFRLGDVRFSQADISKAHRLLGYQPSIRVKQGIEQTVDWHISRLAAGRSDGRRLVPRDIKKDSRVVAGAGQAIS